jgi:hypothetical protein
MTLMPESDVNAAPAKRDLVTTTQAADHLGLAKATLTKLRCVGGGPPYYKVRHRVFYSLGELDDWLAERRYSNTSQYKRK